MCKFEEHCSSIEYNGSVCALVQNSCNIFAIFCYILIIKLRLALFLAIPYLDLNPYF